MIYTHSHVDHFGGVRGVVDEDDLAGGSGSSRPPGFLDAAVSENVIAGPPWPGAREYMYGGLLPRGPARPRRCGLGETMPRRHAGA